MIALGICVIRDQNVYKIVYSFLCVPWDNYWKCAAAMGRTSCTQQFKSVELGAFKTAIHQKHVEAMWLNMCFSAK